jgi:flagellar motor switch protein FliN/FliY
MADNPDGLLSQDDINAALAAAGIAPDVPAEPAPAPTAAAPAADPAPAPAPAVAAAAPAPVESAPDTRVDATGRPFDAVAAAMAAAIEAEAAAAPPPSAAASKATPFEVPELKTANTAAVTAQGIDLLRDVELDVKIELGRSRMLIDDVLHLTEGSVVELDKLAGDPVDVFVNDRLVARGEVLVLNDNFCVRINDILKENADEEEE